MITAKIYGNPYHFYEYYFLNEENIINLYIKYKFDIVNYIDGIYSIIINDDYDTIVITDQYGFYPLFIDINTYDIFDDIPKSYYKKNNIDYEYYKYINNNANKDNYDHSILYKYDNMDNIFYKNFKLHNFNNFIDSINLIKDLSRTAFNNIKLITPKTIKIIDKFNKVKTINYSLKNISVSNIFEYFNNLILNLIKNSNKKYILSPITGGYDCRNIYYALKSNKIENVNHFVYYPEVDFVKEEYNDNSIDYISDNKYDNIDFIHYFDDKINIFNGMSDIYYYYFKFLPVDKYLKCNDSLFITGDGANEYLNGDYNVFYANIENTDQGHMSKIYCKNSIYLPVYCNRVLVDNVNNRRNFMSSLSKYYGYNNCNYYTGKTSTKSINGLFKEHNFCSYVDYYNKFIEDFGNG